MRVFGFSRWGVVSFFLPLFLFFVARGAWCAFALCLCVCAERCVCNLYDVPCIHQIQFTNLPAIYFQYTKLSEAVLKRCNALLFFVVCLCVWFIFLWCWCVSVRFSLRCIGVFGCVDYNLHLFTMYIIINVVLTLFYKLNLHFVLLVCIFVS